MPKTQEQMNAENVTNCPHCGKRVTPAPRLCKCGGGPSGGGKEEKKKTGGQPTTGALKATAIQGSSQEASLATSALQNLSFFAKFIASDTPREYKSKLFTVKSDPENGTLIIEGKEGLPLQSFRKYLDDVKTAVEQASTDDDLLAKVTKFKANVVDHGSQLIITIANKDHFKPFLEYLVKKGLLPQPAADQKAEKDDVKAKSGHQSPLLDAIKRGPRPKDIK